MFTKKERSAFHKEFWTAFGIYMRKHRPTARPKLQWLNYRTGINDLYFRMEVDNKQAAVNIDLQMPEDIRELYWEQWNELKMVFNATAGEDWNWQEIFELPDGRLISRISARLEDVNIYNKNDWQRIFQFLEAHLVAVDEFWADFQEIFKSLE